MKDHKGVGFICLADKGQNSGTNLAESRAGDDLKVNNLPVQVDVMNKLKLLALGEEDKSLDCTENFNYFCIMM